MNYPRCYRKFLSGVCLEPRGKHYMDPVTAAIVENVEYLSRPEVDEMLKEAYERGIKEEREAHDYKE